MPDSIIEHKSRDEAHIRIKKEQNEIQEYLKDIKFKFLLYNTDIDINYLNNLELQKIKDCICNNCGLTGNGFPLEIDHIVPLSRGGIHKKDNFQTLCKSCNTSKNNNITSFINYKLFNKNIRNKIKMLLNNNIDINNKIEDIIKRDIENRIIKTSIYELELYVEKYINKYFIKTKYISWFNKLEKYRNYY